MTLAEWIRRQCNATIEGSTIAAMVADAVCAQLAGAGFGAPPPPMRVLLGNRPGIFLPYAKVLVTEFFEKFGG